MSHTFSELQSVIMAVAKEKGFGTKPDEVNEGHS
jgi:hypothetical protein